MYKNISMYYFSGIGNALTATRWIAEEAKKNGIPEQVIPINRFGKITVPPVQGKRLIGFHYPTHGFSS